VALIDYTMNEQVAVVSMNSGENRFNLKFFEAFNKVLDEVENESAANVMVVKSSDAKIWSNGIDLDWLRSSSQQEGTERGTNFNVEMNNFMKRILVFPMITIAAITGHAFAGGAIMSCAFDFRFMRTDRGYFCFPEVDINIPFTSFFNAIVKKAIPMYKLVELQLSGKRATAEELERHHIIVKACHMDHLMDDVMTFAKTFKKNRNTLKTMKARLHEDIVKVLDMQGERRS